MAHGKLSPKQERFVEQYLIDLNATQAAIRAGYSEKTASVIAAQNLGKLNVQEAIAKQRASLEKKAELTTKRVRLEIARLAFNDPRKAFAEDGSLLPVKQWPDEVAAAISSIEVNELREDGAIIGTVSKVKFWDKGRALELGAKHLGMLTEKLELTGKDGGSIKLTGATDEQLEAIINTGGSG